MDAASTPAASTPDAPAAPETCTVCGEADPDLSIWKDGLICIDCFRDDHYSYLWDF